MLAVVVFVALIATNQPPKKSPDKKAPPAAEEKREDKAPGDKTDGPINPRRQTLDDVQVAIESVSVAPVPIDDLGDARLSERRFLIVRIVVSNLSDTRKLEYKGWAAPFGFPVPYAASVSDNFGNNLSPVTFGLLTRVVGQRLNESIYPRKAISDVLVFEPPVDRCESFKLILPADGAGIAETFTFEISKAAWLPVPRAKRKVEKAPPPKSRVKIPAKPKQPEGPIEAIEVISIAGKGPAVQAFVRFLPSKKTLFVKAGDKVQGWEIVSVDEDSETVTVTNSMGERRRIKKKD